MALGMSYDEYWYGRGDRIKFYKQAHDYKRKETNQILWVQGMYFAHAIACNFDSKGRNKYPEKPLDIFPKTEEEKRIEQEENRKKIIEYFSSFKQRWERGND